MVAPTSPPASLIDRHLALLERLTAVSSPTGDRAGLVRCCEILGAALRDQGLSVEVEATAGVDGCSVPLLHAVSRNARSDGYLLLAGHLDTVQPAAPPRRTRRRLWATGAIDMKGGLVTLVAALALLRERGRSLPDNLRLLVMPDEEIAGPISHRAMRRWTPDARALWILEPGRRPTSAAEEPAAETLVLGRRGMIHWHLRATGRPAHAGNDFWNGRSALAAASEWCVAAADRSRGEGGPVVNPARLVAGEAGFVDQLGEQAGLVGSPRHSNVVPDRARVDGEARFIRRTEGEDLLRDLDQLAGEIGTRRQVELTFEATRLIPPLEPTADSRELAVVAVALGQSHGRRLLLEEDRGGISFANFLDRPGLVPTLDGLGPTGGGMHTRQEFMWLDSFAFRVGLLADLLAIEG